MFGAQLAVGIVSIAMLFAQAAQTPDVRAERQVGAVKSVNAAAREFQLVLDDASEKRVVVAPEASVLRVAPGEKDLSKAAPISVGEIQAGDRVLVRGNSDAARGAFVASKIVVMSKSDIARKHETDREEWRRRGISGRVLAVNAESGEISLMTSGRMGEKITLRLASDAQQRRYRPDSARFTDAVPSTISEIKAGDQIHALGDRKAEDGSFVAEQIVSGSFRNFAAVVTSVDAAKSTISVKDVDGQKVVAVHVGPDAQLRKLTPEAAQRLANGGPGAGMHGASGPGMNGAAGRPGFSQAGPAREPGRPTMRMQALLERMPTFTLQDVKPGDALIICTAANATPEKTSALTILAGAEPLLARPMETQRELLGSWDLNTEPNLP